MKGLALALALLAASACLSSLPSGRFPGSAAAPPGGPSRAVILQLASRADDARAVALAAGEAALLAGSFGGTALIELRAAIEHLRRLHEAVERRLDVRRLVHWSGLGGVLELSGSIRLLRPGSPTRWIHFLEQWQFRLAWSRRWLVVEATDLAPGEWWS